MHAVETAGFVRPSPAVLPAPHTAWTTLVELDLGHFSSRLLGWLGMFYGVYHDDRTSDGNYRRSSIKLWLHSWSEGLSNCYLVRGAWY